ncbi:PP2C family protein-serine/threonine phosphatase [Dyadobacter psychrotolerans]|nr:protein phosphatase 2C domain-containing protein [Dyadobacter psychrotolerans]
MAALIDRMDITISPPLAFTELGRRDNNEDYICPTNVDTDTRLFIVCDGMGGLDKGEDASRITAESVQRFFMENPSETTSEEYIYQAVVSAFEHLKAFAEADSLITRMGSTLTLLHLNSHSVTVAHVGDSRVYHVRDGVILYKTKDHRQVLDMVEQGIITAEQAIDHPWRNRLSRSVSFKVAMSGEAATAQPGKPVVQQITDIQENDYFFLCTDGVLEQITDALLTEVLASDKPNEAKVTEILDRCRPETRDNYTGVLVQIEAVSEAIAYKLPEETDDEAALPKSSFVTWLVTVVLIIGLIVGGYYWYSHQ